eukprot:CAMPEP_0194297498 /NCGR_PEP_ID=MMETSP0169-20130528/59049_1 /TAXON_ID=218684 /ORGANISM="Corethron pennatum, Strain L29A3" /LENGTH=610 /DNA_ID=CAMNT_0039047323 /DNA_START=58 /DNA_END=1886 /DNA_ORIENTATION=+
MNTKTITFFENLEGFLRTRDIVHGVASEVLPDRLVEKYESVNTEKAAPKQTIDANAPMLKQLDELFDLADEIMPVLNEFGKRLVREASDNMLRHDTEMVQQGSTKFYIYTSAPIKSRLRCEAKVRDEYDGNTNRLVDVVRASLVVDSEKYLDSFFAYVFDASRKNEITIVRFKNRFKYPTFSGYRDALFNLLLKSPTSDRTMVVELQIHLAQIITHKEESHKYYEFFREFFAGNMDAVEQRMLLLERMGRNIVHGKNLGYFKLGLSKVIEEASLEQLSGLDHLLGDDGIQDYLLAAIVARRKLVLMEDNGVEDKKSLLDAKMKLGYHIFYSACDTDYSSNRLEIANELVQSVKNAYESLNGPEDPSTIEAELLMLEVQVNLGYYDSDRMEKDLKKMFALAQKVLGQYSETRIQSAFVLGIFMRDEENWTKGGEGEKYLRLAYTWEKETFCSDSEYSYELARLLLTYDHTEALKILREAFKIEIKSTGKNQYCKLIAGLYHEALQEAIQEESSNSALREELEYLKEQMPGCDDSDSGSDSDSDSDIDSDSDCKDEQQVQIGAMSDPTPLSEDMADEVVDSCWKERKWWDELSSEERAPAESLGYNRISWEL